MIYRDFGDTGLKVSALGFGGIHLPMTQKDGVEVVDDELAIPLLRRAVDLGINFFDTAWFYNNEDGNRVYGDALRPVRDKVLISSKVPLFEVHKTEDFDAYLERTLEQMKIDYLDFHHFHAMTYASWKEKILPLKLVDAAERAKAKGLIRHLSFSFHGDPDKMPELIDTGAFSSILGQYNLVDRKNEEFFSYAKSKGIGTAVMGPLMGGNIPAGGSTFLGRMKSDSSSAAEIGLRFVWGFPAVDIALSGMTTMAQLEENVRLAEGADSVSADERRILIEKSASIQDLNDLYCSGCMYCAVCPQGIQPGRIFQLYILHKVWGFSDAVKRRLTMGGRWGMKATPSDCTGCGNCSAHCPQKIEIPAELKRVWPELQSL